MKIASASRPIEMFWNHYKPQYAGEYDILHDFFIKVFELPDKEGNDVILIRSVTYAVEPTIESETIFCTMTGKSFHVSFEKEPTKEELYELLKAAVEEHIAAFIPLKTSNVSRLAELVRLEPIESLDRHLTEGIRQWQDKHASGAS